MKRNPVILVSPDVVVRQVVGVDQRVFEVKAAYTDALLRCGAVPVVASYPVDPSALSGLAAVADGVLLTGGDFDVDPRLYGARPHPRLGTLKPQRTDFELALWALARQRNLPTLGVCGGMQVMNVGVGGTLHQHLPEDLPGPVSHQQAHDRRQPQHRVVVVAGADPHGWLGGEALEVNSTHHQGVAVLGQGVVAMARADDGLVEAMRVEGLRFAVGVQWHPELLTARQGEPDPLAIYRALVAAAAGG